MRICIIYDDNFCSYGPGTYCKTALEELGFEVVHYKPFFVAEHNFVTDNGYRNLPEADLYFQVDDDLSYCGPPKHLKDKSIYWCIDTHRMNDLAPSNKLSLTRWDKIKDFKYIFSANKDFADTNNYPWLPLACDNTITDFSNSYKKNDWCFVGRLNTRQRTLYTNNLKLKYPCCFVGRSNGPKEMIDIFLSSFVVLNITCSNDLNMRFFEGLSSGSIFLTNKINNGEFELFQDNFISYETYSELLKKIKYCFDNYHPLIDQSKEYSKYVRDNHNYKVRMKQMMERIL